ncbi:acetamidase/formamidase family protein [Senna tora]|uniref:Acetamidase/formamidase family protein n=1 Tax=Senna tora TaxID=362788 RepID=A0A834WS43_9FABA|nr:acetamidase/formamidase family protein [Senna tora]
MARLVVPIDLKKKAWEQKLPLHNRWHPEIPAVAEAKVGQVFRVEMVDFSGGAITNTPTAHDIKHADQSIFGSIDKMESVPGKGSNNFLK